MKFIEKTFKRKVVFSGKSVSFAADEITLPDGNKAVREYMLHPGAVCVIPFVDKKDIIMVRQYRYPVRQVTWELPAGKIDKHEKPLACVRRELEEETGFKAKTIKKLASFWPTAAFSDEVIHIYAASGLTCGVHAPDEDEFLSARRVPFASAMKWIKAGRIRDAKTIVGLLFWETYRKSIKQ